MAAGSTGGGWPPDREWRRHSLRLVAALLAFAVGPTAGSAAGARVPARELLAGAPFGDVVTPAGLVTGPEVLAVDAAMEEFVQRYVDRRATAYVRMHQLTRAVMSEATLGLSYDSTTRTAAETFRERRGNCLSFSGMFVALARLAGLKVQFQEVDIPPDWSRREDTFVLNRHVNVVADLGSAGRHAVDFNIEDFAASYRRRTIPDRRALAHFFNNLGVESLQAGDHPAALAYFRSALADHDTGFAPAWTNLGTLYLRAGHLDHAEASWLEALAANPRELVAMSNLVGLYEQRGELERAAALRRKVAEHRRRNPYYRYHLAREAFDRGAYREAVGHLKYAIRSRDQEADFHRLLAECYLGLGDEAAARRSLARAETAAARQGPGRGLAGAIELRPAVGR